MLWRPDEPKADAPFSWVRREGELQVFWQGRSVLRVRGEVAARVAAMLERDGGGPAQRLLARIVEGEVAQGAADDDEGPTLRAA